MSDWEPWGTRKPYTWRQAIDNTRWQLASMWVIAAFECLLMAAAGLPWWQNVALTALLGPVCNVLAVAGRVIVKRRRQR